MEIRFDSLGDSGRRTTRFAGLRRMVTARSVDDVLPALTEIDRAVAGGLHVAGFLGFEAAPAMDPALVAYASHPTAPLLAFGLFEERIEEELSIDTEDSEPAGFEPAIPTLDFANYRDRAERILEYIAAGDTYQVNFTFRLRGKWRGDPTDLYRALCRAQRSDYCAMIRCEDFAILSASPELFFERKGDAIRMKPMKGTRPRGRWSDEDDAMAEDLRASEKDRAENLMIVDLLRNDLGRVARFGSVRVSRLFDIERYPTVLQMTSTVEAELPGPTTLRALFQALFPCGSVTGAPKVRTCEIIRELEGTPRGAYTGAIGFASPGEAAFSVAIRTVLLDLRTGEYELGVGSGITADSDPAAEYAECLNKAAFLRAEAPPKGLIESLRLEIPGGFQRADRHLRRMERSARYFGFRFDRATVDRALLDLTAGLSEGTYKARLELGADGRITATVEKIPATLPPARISLASHPISSTDPYLYHKTTRREPYLTALSDRPRWDDVVLWNEKGEITETSVGNLVLELDGQLVTPVLSSGLLPGIFRESLLEEGTIVERVLTKDDLKRAARIFIVNSVRGWREAVLVKEESA